MTLDVVVRATSSHQHTAASRFASDNVHELGFKCDSVAGPLVLHLGAGVLVRFMKNLDVLASLTWVESCHRQPRFAKIAGNQDFAGSERRHADFLECLLVR